MARAVLRIDADTSGVVRALGDLRGVARSAQAAMTAEARREAVQRDRIARDETRHKQRLELESLRATRTAERTRVSLAQTASRERVSAADREARARVAAETNTARLLIASERNRTLVHIAEERHRTQATVREERLRAQEAQRTARAAANAQRTQARAGRDIGYGLRRGLNVGGDAALNVARTAYGSIRDERLQRAEANRGLTHALGGAGIRGFNAQAQRRVSEFAGRTGMSYGAIVDALVTGQQRGSALELRGRTPETALNDALATVRQANSTGTDAGNLLAARGRLGTAGISGSNLDEVMRFVQFAADRGSVEVDQIIQQGLPGALRLMSSRTAGVSPEQRQRAAVAAFRESVAVQEVMAGAGGRSGQVSNAYSGFQTALNTPRRQDLIRTNLTTYAQSLTGNDATTRARRASVMALVEGPNALYEDDPTRRGARRLRGDVENSPLAMIDRVTQAMGGNANAAASIFAGGGHGNAQGLLSNVRTLMGTLGSINPETGRARSDAVREIMGGGYSAADLAGRQRDVESDDLATIRRNEEDRAKALTDNTSAVVQLARSFENFATRNPIGTAAIQSGAGLLGGIGSFFLGTGTRAALSAITNMGGTLTALSSAGGIVGGAVQAVAGLAAGAVGLGVGSLANQVIYSDRGNSNGNGPAYTNAFSSDFWRGFTTSVAQAFESASAGGHLRATVSAHDATHATTQAANAPSRTTR